jgi:hypothetical protein
MLKIALALQANPDIEADSACRAAWSPTPQSVATPADCALSSSAPLPRTGGCALEATTQTPLSSSDRGLTLRFQSATWSSEPNRPTHKEIHLTPT